MLGALGVPSSIIARAHILLHQIHAGILRTPIFFFFSFRCQDRADAMNSWWMRSQSVAPDILNIEAVRVGGVKTLIVQAVCERFRAQGCYSSCCNRPTN